MNTKGGGVSLRRITHGIYADDDEQVVIYIPAEVLHGWGLEDTPANRALLAAAAEKHHGRPIEWEEVVG
jgi:hypothetical protein